MRQTGTAFCLAALLILGLSPAKAGLTLCNRTSYVLYAATGFLTGNDVTVAGWTRIVPGACAESVKGALTAHQYFIAAKTARAHTGPSRAWSGPVNLCVKDKTFALHQPFAVRCPSDFYQTGFAPVDTKRRQSWTATFRETPDLPSMTAAQRAGLKRLLTDSGAKLLIGDKQIDAALKAFKVRVRLQPGATTAALFDALETEAMKSAEPAGYTLCNDTNVPFYAAIGLQSGTTFLARGWWTVPGASCSQLVTEPVAGRKIWLRVERAKGTALVHGPAKFCVTDIEFDIQGRGRCAQRGLIEAGFAETHGGSASGYTAHVTATGLTRR